MHKQHALLRLGGHQARPQRFPILISAAAAACLIAGLSVLWLHATSDQTLAYRAPGGIVLIILACMQLRLASIAWQQRSTTCSASPQQRRTFLKGLFAGAVLCYVVGLLLGPDPGVGYLFCAALAGWYTAALWLLVVRPKTLSPLAAWSSRGWLARVGQLAFTSLSVTVGAEALMRVYALVADDRLAVTYVASTLALPPGEDFRGQLINRQGYWDDEFKPHPRPGVFRIAVLGDDITLSGSHETNYLSRIERSVPGIEIYNFGLPAAGPREYAAQLMHEVAAYRPDLVLTFFSVGDDLTHKVSLPGMFDWRNLRLYQFGARSAAQTSPFPLLPQFDQAAMPSREDYLTATAARLSVCRTPIAPDMSERWREAMGYLNDISLFCQQRGIAAALVIVPSEFQLNPALCDTLRRRAGIKAAAIDLELPQRRLTDFALERQLPVVDLLPSLRSSPGTLYARNDHHWNDRGHEVAADVLARWIKHRYGSQLDTTVQASLAQRSAIRR